MAMRLPLHLFAGIIAAPVAKRNHSLQLAAPLGCIMNGYLGINIIAELNNESKDSTGCMLNTTGGIPPSLVTLTAILGLVKGAFFAGVNSPDAFANFLSADAIN